MSGIRGFKNLKKDRSSELVGELVQFIITQLSNFTTSQEFLNITSLKSNEDQYSEAYCTYMQFQCDGSYCFSREKSQRGNRTVDIGVYLRGGVLIYNLEAKVLPTPILGDRKEHEYVYGKGGGIQRFKEENHGLDNQDNLISRNGMIAYIKSESFENWHAKVNGWITDASWGETENLYFIEDHKTGILKSTHQRTNGSQLELDHFWVNVK